MKAIVRAITKKIPRKVAHSILGIEEPDIPTVIVTFKGQGVGLELTLEEALELGISRREILELGSRGTQKEFEIKLIKKEAQCGAQN